MSQTHATPGAAKLFDQLRANYRLRNDAALARKLEVQPPVISKMRSGRMPVGASMVINLHETFDMPVKAIKEALA